MTTPATLLVAVDTSPESVAAMEWALRFADQLGWRVVVVHAIGLLEAGGYRKPTDVHGMIAGAVERAGMEPPSVVEIAEAGPAADTILRVAERDGVDLIVVGRRGLGNAPRPIGSTSEAVLASATVPVLVVPLTS